MNLACALLTVLVATTGIVGAQESGAYGIVGTIVVGGSGHWDYLTADSTAHRLYMSHNANLEVVDTASSRKVASLAIGGFTHGIVIAEDLNRGYVTTGKSSLTTQVLHEVVAFDLRTLAVVQRIDVPEAPDGIIYEPVSKTVIAFSGDAHNATAIDAKTGVVRKTIDLEGSPEASVADGKGSVFVNISDTNKLVEIDAAGLSVRTSWPLPGCDGPSGLAMDVAKRRLFAACDNKILTVVNADTGALVAKVPIAPKNDGVAYDPVTRTIFVSTMLGMLSILRDAGSDRYVPLQMLQTPPGSRTITLDSATHSVYLSSAKFAAPKEGQKYPDPIDGTFGALRIDASKS